ncbi:MAG: hypothetical protein PGN07_07310 [Aeromicrobium erythreum]
MARLLLVLHAPTPRTAELADAIEAGSHDDAIEGVEVVRRGPAEVDADAVLAADALVLLSPANFGYMSGLVKDLFDRTFLHVGGALSDDGSGAPSSGGRLPFGLCVHGRYDTEGGRPQHPVDRPGPAVDPGRRPARGPRRRHRGAPGAGVRAGCHPGRHDRSLRRRRRRGLRHCGRPSDLEASDHVGA